MSLYKDVSLYGGAIQALLPKNFIDASNFRQVPDNQEVYLDANGLVSIIFDILSHVNSADEEAALYHLHDLTDGSSEVQVTDTRKAHFDNVPNASGYTLLATTTPTPSEYQQARPPKVDFTAIALLLLRLPEKKTDVLITINVPHVAGEGGYKGLEKEVNISHGPLGMLIEDALQVQKKIIETLKIQDWDLFVDE